jgi:hypothetical protein
MMQLVQWATPSVGYPMHQLWRERRCVIGPISAGTYALTLQALKLTRSGSEWTVAGVVASRTGELTIRDGDTTTFDVR